MKKIVIASIATLTIASSLIAGIPGSCKGCHSADGSTNNFVKGKGNPNQMTKADLLAALKGYKAGTVNKYGKSNMMGAAKGLTDAQQQAIAEEWGK